MDDYISVSDLWHGDISFTSIEANTETNFALFYAVGKFTGQNFYLFL